jgi:hypothetical protein
MRLAYHLIESTGPHTLSERGTVPHELLTMLREKVIAGHLLPL